MRLVRIYFETRIMEGFAWEVDLNTKRVVRCLPFDQRVWVGTLIPDAGSVQPGESIHYLPEGSKKPIPHIHKVARVERVQETERWAL